jgi:hypothetical protein
MGCGLPLAWVDSNARGGISIKKMIVGVVARDTISTYHFTMEFVTDDDLPEQVFMPAAVGFHSCCVSLEYHT